MTSNLIYLVTISLIASFYAFILHYAFIPFLGLLSGIGITTGLLQSILMGISYVIISFQTKKEKQLNSQERIHQPSFIGVALLSLISAINTFIFRFLYENLACNPFKNIFKKKKITYWDS